KEHAKRIIVAAQSGTPGGGIPTEPLPDFSKWGEIERVPMRAVRRKTAEHLSVAWLNIPHVTQQEYADITGLEDLRRRYRNTVEEMQGGCFSISNLGGIGGSFFTPIVNSPEVAILGISRGRFRPIYDEETGEFTARQLLPLSLSYDHRVIDGADGIRFLRWVA